MDRIRKKARMIKSIKPICADGRETHEAAYQTEGYMDGRKRWCRNCTTKKTKRDVKERGVIPYYARRS